jgi:hypothetical protein
VGDYKNSIIGTRLNVCIIDVEFALLKGVHMFMDKKIRRTESTKTSSEKREEKTIIITILLALVILGALLVKLTFFTPIETEPFSAIYYLDSEKQTTNLPKIVILGTNSTFRMYVGVENHNGTSHNGTKVDELTYMVQLKIDDGKGQVDPSLVEPYKTLENNVKYGDVWEEEVIISIEKMGVNRLIFELYTIEKNADPIYTGNWVNLSVEAIEAS